MTKGERLVGEAVLCALYLRGAPFDVVCARRNWPRVLHTVRASCPDATQVREALLASGLFAEAAHFDDGALLDWAMDVVSLGRAVTALDDRYPRGWTDALGSGAPPCAWVRGELPSARAIAVVGSRQLDAIDRSFAAGAGRLLMREGYALVSGGAVGADSVAADAALQAGGHQRCIELLPCGLDHRPARDGVCQLSVCEPSAPFNTGQAMERNALIYAFGRRAIVVRARYREGGTWHGATDALRRRLGAVVVQCREGDRAARALCSLGASPVADPSSLLHLLSGPLMCSQPALFGASAVRDPLPGYVA